MTAKWISVSTPYLLPRAAGEPDAWAAETAEHGQVGSQRLISASTVSAPRLVADALEVPADEPVVLRQRLMLVNDRPVEITNSYYPLWLAGGTALVEPRKIRGGAVTLLGELGFRPKQIREEVESRLPTAEELDLLDLEPTSPVLVLHRLVHSERPVEFSAMTMTAANRRLRYELTV